MLDLIDITVLTVILVCGFEMVRVLNPFHQPWKTVAFVLITVGSFGWINYDITGHSVAWYALILHAGFATCALVVLHSQHAKRRASDRRISQQTRDLLARHRPTGPSPKR
ncbi:MAG: hypothetical protein WA777_20080 [Rhodanobacter sp.]